MTTIRIATLNCENLFSRPRIFRARRDHSLELLGYVSDLQNELSKDVFDHDRIKALKKKLKGYATINDIRGNHTKAKGASEWIGSVELSRSNRDDIAVKNTARVICDIDADIICLIEVEDRPSLQMFHDDLLFSQFMNPAGKQGYEHILLMDGNDRRDIDVSVMSRLPVKWLVSHVHERTLYNGRVAPTFSRDCLEVLVKLPDGNPLLLMVNHFKSKGYSPKNDPLSNRRRRGQAERVRELVELHDLQNEYLIIAGDLNDGATSYALSPLLTKDKLYNANLELDPAERGTYRTGKEQLDYLIMSDAMRGNLQNVYVERRGMYSRKKWPHYETVTGRLTEASDHGAVVADFRIG
ncbi:MAG: endonuclease/exonuclease/phosphatase family protein [Theionarchaea archaeon]|nr:endonuclease/exonuclease/phosphatase family protein [Theionarchaea archaeon]